jgi:hypothetical protein
MRVDAFAVVPATTRLVSRERAGRQAASTCTARQSLGKPGGLPHYARGACATRQGSEIFATLSHSARPGPLISSGSGCSRSGYSAAKPPRRSQEPEDRRPSRKAAPRPSSTSPFRSSPPMASSQPPRSYSYSSRHSASADPENTRAWNTGLVSRHAPGRASGLANIPRIPTGAAGSATAGDLDESRDDRLRANKAATGGIRPPLVADPSRNGDRGCDPRRGLGRRLVASECCAVASVAVASVAVASVAVVAASIALVVAAGPAIVPLHGLWFGSFALEFGGVGDSAAYGRGVVEPDR